MPGMADAPQGSIVFTRDQLLKLQLCGRTGGRPDIPRELRRRYRCCRAGRRRWLRREDIDHISRPSSWGTYDLW